MRFASLFVVVLLLALAPAVARGASIVTATYSIDGNAIAQATYTGEDGGANSDPEPYWDLLGKAPERIYEVKIKPDQKDATTATLKGKINIEVKIRNKFSMGTVTTDSLTLVRDNADSDRWYLPAEELNRLKAILLDKGAKKTNQARG